MDGNRSIVKCHDRSFIHDVPDVADINISYLVDHTIFIRLINLYYCDFIILVMLIFIFILIPIPVSL